VLFESRVATRYESQVLHLMRHPYPETRHSECVAMRDGMKESPAYENHIRTTAKPSDVNAAARVGRVFPNPGSRMSSWCESRFRVPHLIRHPTLRPSFRIAWPLRDGMKESPAYENRLGIKAKPSDVNAAARVGRSCSNLKSRVTSPESRVARRQWQSSEVCIP
jgi:hypothetical protein